MAITLNSDEAADPLQQMVGFLEHPELLNLALSCKSTYRTVEAYCQAALAKIEQESHVDETFAERLRDPSRIRVAGGHQLVSGDLPYRYLLKAARFTYLYMLEMMKPRSYTVGCASALSKDGGRLVVAATVQLRDRSQSDDPNWPPFFVCSWDVTAKPGDTKIYEIPAERCEHANRDVFCMEESVVLCTNYRILTLAIDTGDLTHAYMHPKEVCSVVWLGATGLVFLDDYNKVYSFYVSTGIAHFVACPSTMHEREFNRITGLLHDRWLVINSYERYTFWGLQVIDVSNGCRRSWLNAMRFNMVEQSRASPDMFYTFVDDGHNEVLQLSEAGKFSRVRSYTMPSFPADESYWQEGPQSRWFFEKNRYPDHGKETSMTVRCSKSGERQGSYKLPPNRRQANGMDILSNGKKLFVGLESQFGEGVCVAAFLAKEHF